MGIMQLNRDIITGTRRHVTVVQRFSVICPAPLISTHRPQLYTNCTTLSSVVDGTVHGDRYTATCGTVASPSEIVVVTLRTRRRSPGGRSAGPGGDGGRPVLPGWYVGVAIADWAAGGWPESSNLGTARRSDGRMVTGSQKKKNCCGLHGETQARHRLGGHLSRLIDRSMNAAEKHVD